MKKGYQPQPYHRTEKGTGEHIHMKERAQKAAEYLRDKQWGETKERKEEKNKHSWKISKIRNTKEKYNTGEMTMKELNAVIKKLKRRKAPGPDEIPTEILKEMDEDTEK